MSHADRSAGAQRSPEDGGRGLTGPPISRRQALGRMSALATAGAAAWVAPEILTARPAAGAALSRAARRRLWRHDRFDGFRSDDIGFDDLRVRPARRSRAPAPRTERAWTGAARAPRANRPRLPCWTRWGGPWPVPEPTSSATRPLARRWSPAAGRSIAGPAGRRRSPATRSKRPPWTPLRRPEPLWVEGPGDGRQSMYRTPTLNALSYRFALCTDDARLGRHVDALFAGLRERRRGCRRSLVLASRAVRGHRERLA